MNKYIFLTLAVACSFQLASAQIELGPTVIASAGSYSEADNISLSWTLGEIAVTTLEEGNLVLSQGFQQAYINGTSVKLEELNWQITAYPNPVKNELSIQFDLLETSNFWIEIQDVTGRILSQEQFKEVYSGDIIPVDMSSYKVGIYFCRIFTPDREQMRVISIRKK